MAAGDSHHEMEAMLRKAIILHLESLRKLDKPVPGTKGYRNPGQCEALRKCATYTDCIDQPAVGVSKPKENLR